MHLVYIDESADEKLMIYSALLIQDACWKHAKDQIASMRKRMMDKCGIPSRRELHAWKFVSGRGRFKKFLTKSQRALIFRFVLRYIAREIGPVRLINVVAPLERSDRAFEYLTNRINTYAKSEKSYVVVFVDQGKEGRLRKMVRKMGVYNPIPSMFGIWDSGEPSRNIPTERILEDPVFLDSKASNFIQLVDFCAYSLLRRERPTDRARQYGIDTCFEELRPILLREASKKDPEGIVRA